MTVIVEQLKHFASKMKPSGLGGGGYALSWEKAPMLEQAAAEIERLQAEVVQWKREAGKYSAGCELCAPREAEIERLVAALKEIDGWRNDTLGVRPKPPSEFDCPQGITDAFDRGARMAFYRCSDRARQALEQRAGD